MKTITMIMILSALVILGFFFFTSSKKSPSVSTELITSAPQAKASVDKKASFAVFTNGTFRIFTASMYHNLSSDAYIESSNPNIVHIKKENITWDDFFKTLPLNLSRDCLTTGTGETFCTGERGALKFYINGKFDDNALSQEIDDGDQLLVTFGRETDTQIQKQLQQIPKAE